MYSHQGKTESQIATGLNLALKTVQKELWELRARNQVVFSTEASYVVGKKSQMVRHYRTPVGMTKWESVPGPKSTGRRATKDTPVHKSECVQGLPTEPDKPLRIEFQSVLLNRKTPQEIVENLTISEAKELQQILNSLLK